MRMVAEDRTNTTMFGLIGTDYGKPTALMHCFQQPTVLEDLHQPQAAARGMSTAAVEYRDYTTHEHKRTRGRTPREGGRLILTQVRGEQPYATEHTAPKAGTDLHQGRRREGVHAQRVPGASSSAQNLLGLCAITHHVHLSAIQSNPKLSGGRRAGQHPPRP